MKFAQRFAFMPVAVLLFYTLPVRVEVGTWGRGFLAVAMLVVLALLIVRQLRDRGDQLTQLVHLLTLVIAGCSFAVYMMSIQMPGQFEGILTRTDALYFTLTTISTVGYGDIHPVGQQARVLVSLMIVFNLVFLAALARAIMKGLAARRSAARSDEA